jgi:predicted component of type VI protein secretion system
MLSGRDNNPLKLKLSPAELVQYLFAAPAGAGAYMPADRAVRESIAELRVHEHATIAAARAAVEGALRDFEPGRMRKKLLKGKSGLFQMMDNARLWDAYEADYEKQSQHMADWLETLFDRHFMPTYSRETERMKQMAGGGPAS